jgi:L-asparaginase
MEAALELGDVKGLVLASPNGGVGAEAIIARVAEQVPVVRHVRINVGMIAPSAEAPTANNVTISSGLVNNQKSRIQLQLALATGADPRETFEEPLRSILYA